MEVSGLQVMRQRCEMGQRVLQTLYLRDQGKRALQRSLKEEQPLKL